MFKHSSLRIGLKSILVSLFIFQPVWADDTEIFFNSAAIAGVQPNLLFILDASYSMKWFDCLDDDLPPAKSYDCGDDSPNGTVSRRDRMVEAMHQVLDSSTDINVGLMRFGGFDGGRIVFPVTDIDGKACSDQRCNETTVFDAQATGLGSDDDAQQNSTGGVLTAELTLPLTDAGHISAMRSQDLRIPQGATIDDARLTFTAETTNAAGTNLTVKVEDVADSSEFIDATTSTISARSWLPASVAWNAVQTWTADGKYESPNLSSLIQHVVNKTDWCGGNHVSLSVTGTGNRVAKSFDQGNGSGPILKVKYRLDGIPAGGGCTVKRANFLIDRGSEDSNEQAAGAVQETDDWVTIFDNYLAGLQFKNVTIPQGAHIRSASVVLIRGWGGADNNKGNDLEADISMENAAAPTPIAATAFNLSNRAKTAAVNWLVPKPGGNVAVTTPDLSGLMNQIVSKADWEPGNRMTVFLEKTAGINTSRRGFYSYNKNRQRAAHLNVTYETTVSTAEEMGGDVRSRLKKETEDLVTVLGTPTVGALEEAMRYYGGQPVNFGKHRVTTTSAIDTQFSRVSHPASYTGGNVVRDQACHDHNLNSKACESEVVDGAPVYDSPIEMECQPNYVVLLTDGAPWVGNTEDPLPTEYYDTISNIETLTGEACADNYSVHARCGPELAEHMYTGDLDTVIPGDQGVITHAIGFNVTSDWIIDVAEAGGGNYYTAESTDDLVAAISEIITEASDSASTFVAPAATLDQFSRAAHRSDVYLALFKPQATASWHGNLKRYNISGNPPTLKDDSDPPIDAVDAASGEFVATAKSFWSATADGSSVGSGGAAALLDANSRDMITNVDPNSNDLSAISINNGFINPATFGASDADELEVLINWLAGFDLKDEDDDTSTLYRHHIGDPLHSKPVVVTYGGTDDDPVDEDEPNSVVFFGTNEGFLHAINTIDGKEEFAFMPSDLLGNVPALFANQPSVRDASKPYGMDGDLTLWMQDDNNNGFVDSADGEKAYLYAGMRRGGQNYYALDVSDIDNPVLKWTIKSGTDGFAELGQTWSRPILADIRLNNVLTKVLVFGGGYDPSQDSATERSTDTMGRALYIVNAETGVKIWSGGPATLLTGTVGYHKTFTDMAYSIPSDLKVITAGDKNLLSQIYVGDMGGRVWRFDINNGAAAANLVDGGIIADFGVNNDPVGARRFYHAPDLSLTRVNGKKALNVAIGSGYRAHPLNNTIEDKFFMFRYPFRKRGASSYGIKDPADDTYGPIYLDDLFDTTANLIGQGTADEVSLAEGALASKEGWYITMELAGEKILGTSATLENIIRFVSYVPLQSDDPCDPNLGESYYWAVNLVDGTPIESDNDADNTDPSNPDGQRTKEHRKSKIPVEGLAPPVSVIFVAEGDEVTPVDMSGANVLKDWDNVNMTRRWYWAEYPE